MKPAAFDYVRACSVAEAAELLAAGDGAARILAGGMSLGPMLNLRLARPGRLVDVKRAEGLRAYAADAQVASIGAGFTHAEIEDGLVEDPTGGLLRHVAGGIAYRAVRNRGTLGGSLSHADPAADWVSTMAALDAVIVATGPGGTQRRIGAAGFVQGAFATALRADEVLTAVEIPRASPSVRWGYHKVCRKTGEFAKAIGVAILDPGRGVARLLAGAVEGPPVLLPGAARLLLEAGPEAAGEAVTAEIAALLPHLDAPGQRLHAVALRRAIASLTETA
jgi:carbon-monoxide dehydrogenase medium subunit